MELFLIFPQPKKLFCQKKKLKKAENMSFLYAKKKEPLICPPNFTIKRTIQHYCIDRGRVSNALALKGCLDNANMQSSDIQTWLYLVGV